MAGAEGLAAVANREVQVIEGVVGEQAVVAGPGLHPDAAAVRCGSRSLSGTASHGLAPPTAGAVQRGDDGLGMSSQRVNRHRLSGDQERPCLGIELVGTRSLNQITVGISAGSGPNLVRAGEPPAAAGQPGQTRQRLLSRVDGGSGADHQAAAQQRTPVEVGGRGRAAE